MMLGRVFVAVVAAASAAVMIAPDGASARFGGGGSHGFGAHNAFGSFHAHARLPFFRRRFAPLWYPPYGDSLGYDGNDIGAIVSGDGGSIAVLRPVIAQPPCRVQFETRVVPAERGGTRSVTVTKCALPQAGQAGPYGAVAEAADDPKLTTGGLGEDKPIDAQGCRADTRTVPAEGGGERKVTITRC